MTKEVVANMGRNVSLNVEDYLISLDDKVTYDFKHDFIFETNKIQ